MTDLWLEKKGPALVPCRKDSIEAFARLKEGVQYRADVKLPRNYEHLKKYFAMLNVVLHYTDKFDNVEQILHILKIRLGHFDAIIEPATGKTFLHPKSISFAKMSQPEFDKFYKESLDAIFKYFLPGWTGDQFEEALEQVKGFV